MSWVKAQTVEPLIDGQVMNLGMLSYDKIALCEMKPYIYMFIPNSVYV